MPKVLLLAWEKFFEIKHREKQHPPEDIQELIRKLLEDVQFISEELADYINSQNIITSGLPPCVAVTPVLLTEEPVDSLIMEDEHLDTIPATESDEVVKSSVEELVPIPSESEGISDGVCDVPLCDNPTPLEAFKDHSEIVVDSNDDSSSSDDDSFSSKDIEYVDASPPDAKIVSLEVVEIAIPEVGRVDTDILLTIKDDILREKLLNVNLLIAKIKALKDNPTPSYDFVTKSPSTSPNFSWRRLTPLIILYPNLKLFALIWKRLVVAVPLLVLIILFRIMKLSIILKRRVVAVPLLMLILLNMIRSSLIFRSIPFPPADRMILS
ncbi:hypothetical protein Tco_1293563 [Tanacetum coccineum]